MFSEAKRIYLATRKRNDQIFNTYLMRPVAAFFVGIFARTPVTPNQLTIVSLFLFAVGAALVVALPSLAGGIIAALVIELSYLFDCADGMLARHQKRASKVGHLFDFFTDEIKAVMLVGTLAVRGWLAGGWGIDLTVWPPGEVAFLFAGLAGVGVVASATSLTNFVRHPDISGRETPVSAHYETVETQAPRSPVRWAAAQVFTFLRFLNHYPSHIWVFAAFGRLDLFFWVYASINLLYLAQGWLGLLWRFGRPTDPSEGHQARPAGGRATGG